MNLNQTLTTNTKPIRTALRGNAIFSALSAIEFIFFSKVFSPLFGLSNLMILPLIGVGLLGWAAFLWLSTRRQDFQKMVALIAIDGDLLWVVASVALLVGNWIAYTQMGMWIIAIKADVVLIFAVWQFFALRKASA